uniref:Putative terminase n=1 Tax=viral metagenome TaxID=1070528 RepID=A0A6M3XHZ6_9ZZZZ
MTQNFSEQFESFTDEQKHEFFSQQSLLYFVKQTPVIVDGKPYDFLKHRYMIEILKDVSPDITYQKAAQMGASLKEIIECIWLCKFMFPHGILYLIPTKTDVIDFSKKKFDKVVDENPIMYNWIKDVRNSVDTTGLKQIGASWMLFRGMKSSVGLKVQDVDMIVYDEIEEASELAIQLAEKRTDHSRFKWRRRLSVPSDYDCGVNKYFQEGDQKYWMHRCSHCNSYTCLEEEFPNCLHDFGGKVIRACHKCGKGLDPNYERNAWVAKYPETKVKHSYQISQLWSDFVNPKDILYEYSNTRNMAGFYNNTLGIPYTDVTARITAEQVLALCSQELMLEDDKGPCMMGVDPGKLHYLVIGKRTSEFNIKIIRLGIVSDIEDRNGEAVASWDVIGKIIKKFNVTCCVIDGRPYIDDSRKLANDFPGKVYLYFHSENQRGQALWRDKDWTVNINACEAMDASHSALREGRTSLPRRSKLIETFAKHCHNTGRKLEEDEDTGDRRYWWKKLGEDHFRRAFNLMVLASEKTGIATKKRKSRKKSLPVFSYEMQEGVSGYGG